MTIGMLIEMIASKCVFAADVEMDGMPFNKTHREFQRKYSKEGSQFFNTIGDLDLDEELPESSEKRMDVIRKILKSAGLNDMGVCRRYNGYNSKMIGGDSRYGAGHMFSGYAAQMTLPHLPRDKMHARRDGPVQPNTHQASEGKQAMGGFKFAEMESWCAIGAGATSLLRDRLCNAAGASQPHPCPQCGFLGIAYNDKRIYYCPHCKSDRLPKRVKVPFMFVKYVQSMMTMNIAPRIMLSTPYPTNSTLDLSTMPNPLAS